MKDWELTAIDNSSCVSGFAYDHETKTARVEYEATGVVYEYYDVEPDICEKILTADSVGRVINDMIKNGSTGYKKITD